MVVRELTAAFGEFFPRTAAPPPIGSGTGGDRHRTRATGRPERRARRHAASRILGSYQISIPVRTREVMLVPEERLLSVLKWIQLSIPPTDRWFLVFNRYVEQIGDRVGPRWAATRTRSRPRPPAIRASQTTREALCHR